MSSNRKLLAEVDRVLKKIVEGNELFDDIWDKVHTASQQNQKEKYEQDLKKEIKKLQRLREQVKTWATNAEIRNKDPLLEARRSVEERMEKFKELEREMKTKAYSREGLSKTGKLSAEEQAQEDCKNWISDRIEEIQTQLEAVEADVESLSTTAKKKSKNADKIKDLEERIATHKWHMGQLEMLIRAVDNGVINTDEVEDLKEDISFYIESNTEPDFYNDDTLYEQVDLEERMASHGLVTAAAAAAAATSSAAAQPASSGKEKKSKKDDDSGESKKKKKKDKSKKKKDDKEAAETDVLLAQQQQRAAILEQQQQAQKARKEKEKLELARQRDEEARRKEAEAREAQQTTDAQRVDATGAQRGTPSPGETAASGNGSNELRAAGSVPQGLPQAPSSSASGAPSSASATSASSHQGQHPPTLPPAQPSPGAGPASTLQHATSASSNTSSANGQSVSQLPPAQQQQQQQQQHHPPVTGAASSGSTDGSPSAQPSSPQQSLQGAQEGSPAQFPAGTPADAPPLVHSRPTRQITLPGLDLRQKLAMLDSSLLHIPGPSESERTKTYTPRNPFSTPANFPANPPASFANAAFMEKLDPDTLFFIFFHQQNTHQQYLAARELKRQSWRYHKKYHTWFQRHEEPRTTTDEYEVGTYVYFDFETNWGQRIKPNFTFEYAYLEDEVPTASPKPKPIQS
ncbi:General negative regulator of transcription subunit 3 [Hondaea fermentalgiana]|uniref:General negative regulator of transcription subunit 3 n=1 Tax=Hondaea fermentalgiana TaxID=2315210 RepID=A0A2R5GG86_9STRA|nr:General negative regulator of transcription subunit 3 [Hondaea fermentalgiana]|eukprot:GBG29922.1 General negative regulator of transcription subunit 3 [Hondaea fermentalgiana]